MMSSHVRDPKMAATAATSSPSHRQLFSVPSALQESCQDINYGRHFSAPKINQQCLDTLYLDDSAVPYRCFHSPSSACGLLNASRRSVCAI